RIGNQKTPFPLGTLASYQPQETGRLYVQVNDLDLKDHTGSVTLEIKGAAWATGAAPPLPGPTLTEALEAEVQALAVRTENPAEKADELAASLRDLGRRCPTTPQALRAAELLTRLPSPLDQFDAGKVPLAALTAAGSGDPAKAPPGLVAVLGDGRFRH